MRRSKQFYLLEMKLLKILAILIVGLTDVSAESLFEVRLVHGRQVEEGDMYEFKGEKIFTGKNAVLSDEHVKTISVRASSFPEEEPKIPLEDRQATISVKLHEDATAYFNRLVKESEGGVDLAIIFDGSVVAVGKVSEKIERGFEFGTSMTCADAMAFRARFMTRSCVPEP